MVRVTFFVGKRIEKEPSQKGQEVERAVDEALQELGRSYPVLEWYMKGRLNQRTLTTLVNGGCNTKFRCV